MSEIIYNGKKYKATPAHEFFVGPYTPQKHRVNRVGHATVNCIEGVPGNVRAAAVVVEATLKKLS